MKIIWINMNTQCVFIFKVVVTKNRDISKNNLVAINLFFFTNTLHIDIIWVVILSNFWTLSSLSHTKGKECILRPPPASTKVKFSHVCAAGVYYTLSNH